jgi:hypothetical protein
LKSVPRKMITLQRRHPVSTQNVVDASFTATYEAQGPKIHILFAKLTI